jgi:Tfp pilus assembly protein PilO
MSEAVVATPRPSGNSLTNLIDSRRGKMFGIAEIIALALSCFVLFLVLLSYLYFLVPARARRATVEADQARLQSNLQKLRGIVGVAQSTQQRADAISTSLDRFETVSLVRPDEGRMALYGELNQLMTKNGLRNTSGPSYTTLDPIGSKVTPGASANTKWQSVYPGIGVLVTVEGSYQNLRRFIQDLERTKQFVIINEVELQRAENSSQIAAPTDSETGTRESLVSLQLNMTMYFQRNGTENGVSGQER